MTGLCATLASSSATAQDYPRLSAAAVGTSVNATSVLANGTAEMNGKLYGGEGLVSWRSLSMRVGYAQGTLGIGSAQPGSPDADPAEGGVVGGLLNGLLGPGGGSSPLNDLQMVEGFALVGLKVMRGVELASGVQGRARLTDEDSERLLLWVVRARYESPLLSQTLRGYLEGWGSVAGSASSPQRNGSGLGGSVGVIADFGPLTARMNYGIDEARYGAGVRRETVEGVTVSLGYAVR